MSDRPSDATKSRLMLAFAPAAIESLLWFKFGSHDGAATVAVAMAGVTWFLGRPGLIDVAFRRDMSPRAAGNGAFTLLLPGLNLLTLAFFLWRDSGPDPVAEASAQAEIARERSEAARERAARRAEERRTNPGAAQAQAGPAAASRPDRAGSAGRDPLAGILPAIKATGMTPPAAGEHFEVKIDGAGDKQLAPPVFHVTPDGFGVVYVVDKGDHYTWLTRADMEAAGCTTADVHRAALRNLVALIGGKPGLRILNGKYRGLVLNGNHEASLVLLDELWDGNKLDGATPNGAVVSIPARDVCAFCDAADREAIRALRTIGPRVRKGGAAPSTLVTDTLYVRRGGRWHPLPA
jgi:hypothetical protein